MNILQTFNERRVELIHSLYQHVTISLIALLLAMLIAIPLAIWLVKHKKLAEVMLQITGVLQTIPSLALLGLLIPIVGIGNPPAIIALVIYALLPIFQNTYVGLSEIDPSLDEAATAFGLSRFQKLIKVELPIAFPVIISGIRTALVLIIGTATLAALIGAGGLGSFILLGIDRNDPNLIILGAISAALLAIVFSSFIRLLQKRSPQQRLLLISIFIIAFSAIVGYQTFSSAPPKTQIVIAGKLGSEPDILINLYKILIENDHPHVQIVLKPNFGKTSFLFNALRNQQIDIYPEFTGTVLESLVTRSKEEVGQVYDASTTYQLAKEKLSAQFQLVYLPPMAYQNTYALAVKQSLADANQLHNISDLRKIQNELHAGMTLEFIDRQDGYRGLQRLYALQFKVDAMEPALRYQAIHNDTVNLIDAYSTDSQIKQYALVTLNDDQQLFPPYQGAPLVSEAFAQQYPSIINSLNKLAGKITEQEMVEMNYAVNVNKDSPAHVARQYLLTHQLIVK